MAGSGHRGLGCVPEDLMGAVFTRRHKGPKSLWHNQALHDGDIEDAEEQSVSLGFHSVSSVSSVVASCGVDFAKHS